MNHLSEDAQVIVLLCTRLARPDQVKDSGHKPLSPREWHDLALLLHDRSVRPSSLLLLNARRIEDDLGIPPAQAQRLAGLLDQSGVLAFEMERLNQQSLWVVTRADGTYPSRIRRLLNANAPPVLFGAGPISLLNHDSMAIIGSRDADETARLFSAKLAERCAEEGLAVISGGARGVDQIGMEGALKASGNAVGVLADSLLRTLRTREVRDYISSGRLTLISPYGPDAHFDVALAMGRNRLIYCLSDFAAVVSSSLGSGGTWAGATEALKARWVPVLVRQGDGVPDGNRALLELGGIPLPEEVVHQSHALRNLLDAQVGFAQPKQRTGSSRTGEQLSLRLQ